MEKFFIEFAQKWKSAKQEEEEGKKLQGAEKKKQEKNEIKRIRKWDTKCSMEAVRECVCAVCMLDVCECVLLLLLGGTTTFLATYFCVEKFGT